MKQCHESLIMSNKRAKSKQITADPVIANMYANDRQLPVQISDA